MPNLIKLTFVSLLFLSNIVYGQRIISGKIRDQEGMPLRYATVELQKDSIELSATSSDSLGNYKLLNVNSGKYQIRVSFLDYEKKLSLLI